MVNAMGSAAVPYRATNASFTKPVQGLQQDTSNPPLTSSPNSLAQFGVGTSAGNGNLNDLMGMFFQFMQLILQAFLSMFGGKGGNGTDSGLSSMSSGSSDNPGTGSAGPGGITPTFSSGTNSDGAKSNTQSVGTSVPVASLSNLSSPLDGKYPITSRFGDNEAFRKGNAHTGIDIGAPGGTPIKAMSGGRVEEVGTNPSKGRGYYVKVDLGNGVKMYYSHMQSPPSVKVGQTLNQGQVMGKVGTTGFSTGNHLMVEVEKNGQMINPENYFRFA